MQDVYTGVAEEVAKIAETDAKAGVLEAQALLGCINRKLVKQTVMTSVYGVTAVGAREQVQNRLKDRGWTVPDDLTFQVASYAAKVCTLCNPGLLPHAEVESKSQTSDLMAESRSNRSSLHGGQDPEGLGAPPSRHFNYSWTLPQSTPLASGLSSYICNQMSARTPDCCTQATMQGLSAKFSRATEIMRWLRQSASAVAKTTGRPVAWSTPLGLRCVQPYVKHVRLSPQIEKALGTCKAVSNCTWHGICAGKFLIIQRCKHPAHFF